MNRFERLSALCLLITCASTGLQPSEVQAKPALEQETVDSNHAPVMIRGRVIDEKGQSIVGGNVTIGKQQTRVAIDGGYTISVQPSRVYSVRYSAEGFYPIVHTFHPEEISGVTGQLPPVTLVRKKLGRVMFAFGGDAMMGRRFKDPFPGEKQWIRSGHELEDSKTLLQHIKPYTELADYASVNLECTLIEKEPETVAQKSYVFFSHPQTLPALEWAGIDYVCLGNNHTNDYLDVGLESTFAAFESSSIGYSGAGLNEKQALAAHRENIQGIDYSLLGFVSWKGTSNPTQVAGPDKGGAAYGTTGNIERAVQKEVDEDRAVVVQYHGGSEYSYVPSKRTKGRLKAAIDTGADLVIGHHPHVLQGFELYKGKLIAYSLGNFLFDQYRYETQRSALLYVWMDGEEFHRAEIVPIHIQSYHVTPATGNVREYVLRRLIHQSEALGVRLSVSGGHGVVLPSGENLLRSHFTSHTDSTPQQSESGIRELPLDWYQQLASQEIEGSSTPFHVGRDILLLGDFEQNDLYNLSNNAWQFNHQETGVVKSSRGEGRFSLRISPSDLQAQSFARQRYFNRFIDSKPSSPMTLVGFARSDSPAKLSICLDLWPSKWGRTRAQENPKQKCIETIDIEAGAWRRFEVDIEPLGKLYKGFKLRFSNEYIEGANQATLHLDDLALIAWELVGHADGQKTRHLREWNFDYIRDSKRDYSQRVFNVIDLSAQQSDSGT